MDSQVKVETMVEDDKQSVKRNADSFLALKPVAKRFKPVLSPRSPKSTTKESPSKPINLDKLKFPVKFYFFVFLSFLFVFSLIDNYMKYEFILENQIDIS